MVETMKLVAPKGKQLSEAIGAVLKDYEGPVDVSIITKKIQADHADWKLPERRVNKFVKRYMNKHKNPAGADDDQTASVYKKTKRGIMNMISMPSKKNTLLAKPILEPKSEAAPSPTPAASAGSEDPPAASKTPTEEMPKKEEKALSPEKEDPEQTIAEVPSKDIAYETDNEVVDGKNDCWGLSCSVM